MSDTKDMVHFELPDGTKVSNDPRFGLEEALQDQLDSSEYTGDAGVHRDDQEAQTQVTHVASMNSGQPGVGDNATPDDAVKDAYGPLGSPAQQMQKDDVKEAKEAGASPKSTSVEDPEPVDSNQAVLDARKAREEAAEAFRKAQEKLAAADMEPGDPDQPYSEWKPNQLKLEVARRNADGRDEAQFLKIKAGMKKSDVADMLDEDDARADTNYES